MDIEYKNINYNAPSEEEEEDDPDNPRPAPNRKVQSLKTILSAKNDDFNKKIEEE